MSTTALLLIILAYFGQTSPDVEPAIQPFYNDIPQGNDGFDNLSRYRSGDQFITITEEMTDFQFIHVINGDSVAGFSPSFNEFEWSCDGSFYVELICTHVPTATTYKKPILAYANWGGLDYPSCLGEDCPICVDPIWTNYEPYEFAITPDWDIVPDFTCNTADIVEALGQ